MCFYSQFDACWCCWSRINGLHNTSMSFSLSLFHPFTPTNRWFSLALPVFLFFSRSFDLLIFSHFIFITIPHLKCLTHRHTERMWIKLLRNMAIEMWLKEFVWNWCLCARTFKVVVRATVCCWQRLPLCVGVAWLSNRNIYHSCFYLSFFFSFSTSSTMFFIATILVFSLLLSSSSSSSSLLSSFSWPLSIFILLTVRKTIYFGKIYC